MSQQRNCDNPDCAKVFSLTLPGPEHHVNHFKEGGKYFCSLGCKVTYIAEHLTCDHAQCSQLATMEYTPYCAETYMVCSPEHGKAMSGMVCGPAVPEPVHNAT